MREYELPYPPSINHYWRRVGPRTLISREGRAFRRKVCSILAAMGVETFEGPIVVALDLYPPDRRRRDADNSLKAVCDALEKAGAYEDDSQIVRLTVEKREPLPPAGMAIVRIWKEGEWRRHSTAAR